MTTERRTFCMQISTSVYRWPDDMLQHFGTVDGRQATPDEVRAYLHTQEDLGVKVLPCSHHKCDETGHCTGEPLD